MSEGFLAGPKDISPRSDSGTGDAAHRPALREGRGSRVPSNPFHIQKSKIRMP